MSQRHENKNILIEIRTQMKVKRVRVNNTRKDRSVGKTTKKT
jgi:hypothetical protein